MGPSRSQVSTTGTIINKILGRKFAKVDKGMSEGNLVVVYDKNSETAGEILAHPIHILAHPILELTTS